MLPKGELILPCQVTAEVAQQTKPNAVMRHLLTGLFRAAYLLNEIVVRPSVQKNRVSRGKPPDGFRDVEFCKQVFAAVAFERDTHTLLSRPLCDDLNQGSQENVIDVGI